MLEAPDVDLVADAVAHFERIWTDSTPIDPRTVGVVIGEPTTMQFDDVMLRQVKRSQYVVAECEGWVATGEDR